MSMAWEEYMDAKYIIPEIIFILLVSYFVVTKGKSKNLPPGPRALVPVLGNLYGINKHNMLGVLREYRRMYGNLYTLKLGSKTVIVVNGYEDLEEMFVKHADVYSNRPRIFTYNLFGGHGIITTDGNLWKEQRTFALSALRSFGFGRRSLEPNFIEEVEVLVTSLEDTKGRNFNVNTLIHTCVSNVICSFAFGKRFEHTDPEFVKLLDILDEAFKVTGAAGPLNFIPLRRYFPKDPFGANRVIQIKQKIDSFIGNLIVEHKRTYEKGNQRDFIDAYLDEQSRQEYVPNSTFTDEQLLQLLADFFIGGTETTATTLRWAILYLILYPKIQKRLRTEIENVVESSRFPSLNDRSSLPFCDAVITEVLRCGNIVPLSVLHQPSRDTVYNGYTIPKNVLLIPNLDSVMQDETLFPEPTKFNPDRFIDEKGNFYGYEKVIAFSLGRRVCLGESLARMELFLFLTAIIQRFNFLPEEGKQPPAPDGALGATRAPPTFLIRAERIEK